MANAHPETKVDDIFMADMEELEGESKIANIFEDATIFLTGGTGSLGKLYLEKLLRSCPKLKKIYLLARPKKGKDAESRFREIFESPCMVLLRRENLTYLNKIAIINGDCALPDIGLNEEDKNTIIQETNFIIHCAATVRFNEKIQRAAYINVRGVRDLLSMAKEMKGLKAFLHVSTAYSNCPRKYIEEKFYDPAITPEILLDLVETLDEERLTNMTPGLLGEWPNTYALTKAIAEELIKREVKKLPIAVLRPSIVTASKNEPIKGWIDNLYGPVGITLGVCLGLIRTLHGDMKIRVDLIPSDVVINAGIAVVWETVNNRETKKLYQTETKRLEEPIYNIVSAAESPITWEKFSALTQEMALQVQSELAIWHHFFKMWPKKYQYEVTRLFLHTIPAHLIDFFCLCLGKERRMVKGYEKIESAIDVISYFTQREWRFTNDNVQKLWEKMEPEDQKRFFFTMKNFDWKTYFYFFARGSRVFLLKDPLDTIPKGKVKYWKLFVAHYALIALLLFLLFKLLCLLWSCLF